MIKIMIVDDHLIIREGLKKLLEFDDNIEVVAEAADGVECINKIDGAKPDIILLDINMPNMNGVQVIEYLKNNNYQEKILVLTIHNEVEWLLKVFDMGIQGYILKDSKFDELKKAIYEVYEGESYIQPSLIPELNNKLVNRDNEYDKLDSLTDREIEILKKVAEGLLNKEIASELDISERTVKNHISNIFRKIDVCDRTQAAVFAIKNNVIKI